MKTPAYELASFYNALSHLCSDLINVRMQLEECLARSLNLLEHPNPECVRDTIDVHRDELRAMQLRIDAGLATSSLMMERLYHLPSFSEAEEPEVVGVASDE